MTQHPNQDMLDRLTEQLAIATGTRSSSQELQQLRHEISQVRAAAAEAYDMMTTALEALDGAFRRDNLPLAK